MQDHVIVSIVECMWWWCIRWKYDILNESFCLSTKWNLLFTRLICSVVRLNLNIREKKAMSGIHSCSDMINSKCKIYVWLPFGHFYGFSVDLYSVDVPLMVIHLRSIDLMSILRKCVALNLGDLLILVFLVVSIWCLVFALWLSSILFDRLSLLFGHVVPLAVCFVSEVWPISLSVASMVNHCCRW